MDIDALDCARCTHCVHQIADGDLRSQVSDKCNSPGTQGKLVRVHNSEKCLFIDDPPLMIRATAVINMAGLAAHTVGQAATMAYTPINGAATLSLFAFQSLIRTVCV